MRASTDTTIPARKKYGYLLFLLPPALPVLAVQLASRLGHWNLFAFLVPAVVFGLIPVVDFLIGKDAHNPDATEEVQLRADRFYTTLLVLCLPVQLACVGYGAYVVTHAPLSMLGKLGWTLSIGLVSGVIAINTGHELIHRGSRALQAVGGLLLSTVGYASFKVEHVLGHHVHVATPKDNSTAREGETVYAFAVRALARNIPHAFALERAAALRKGLPHGLLSSELARYYALTLAFFVGALVAFGPAGGAFFLGQGVIAILLLEIVNYVEHYGLSRRVINDRGAYEVTTPLHSWNSNYFVTNLLLFQLQRHSDHHANAARPYQVLRHMEGSPQLPAGYATMVVVALCPPLFHVLMSRKLRDHRLAHASS